MIITIDGPAGSGKSTAARKLAEALGVAYLDTGATYRAVTLKAMRRGADLQDADALAEVARQADISLRPLPSSTDVTLDGQDVSKEIRSEEVSVNSYYIAHCPQVRSVLVDLQRRIGRRLGDFVAEGRDQGSVVFPHADMKFYLDATPEVRARRRYDEMRDAGERVEYRHVLDNLLTRDGHDRSRAVAPLVRPHGAIEIDTTDKSIQQVTDELLEHVKAKGLGT